MFAYIGRRRSGIGRGRTGGDGRADRAGSVGTGGGRTGKEGRENTGRQGQAQAGQAQAV